MRIDVRGLFAALAAAGHDARLGPGEDGVATLRVHVRSGDALDCLLVREDGVVHLDVTWEWQADGGLRATLDALAVVRSFLGDDEGA